MDPSTEVEGDDQEVRFRTAVAADLPVIVAMLAADPLGANRERADPDVGPEYVSAFEAIDSDANQELIVAVLHEDIVGVLQLTFIPSLTYRGRWRAQIEGVRVAEQVRSRGVGGQLIRHAVEKAVARSCRMVQLTSDKQRPRAISFYERLGFVASHEGMKLHLE